MKAWTRSWRLPIIPAKATAGYDRVHSSTMEQYIEAARGAAQHHITALQPVNTHPPLRITASHAAETAVQSGLSQMSAPETMS